MSVFENIHFDGHEQVVFCHDTKSGLKAIIAIHNTNRGPSLGGCRMWSYEHEADAVSDVLRLSRGMTYKNALADLPWGGGKSVIIGNAKTDKTPELMQALGRYVETLSGRYTIAEDVGTTPADMKEIAKNTTHVQGVEGEGYDPSPATAFGVFTGLKASVREKLGRSDVEGIRIAVQGLGHVGYDLASQLHDAGAELVVTDIDETAVTRARTELGAKAVGLNDIYAQDVDVFAPCALGAIINDDTIPQLRAKVIAGAANNQLAEDRHGEILHERGILYAPDYAINAGGVIHIYHEGPGYDKQKAFAHVGRIGDTITEIFARAKKDGISPNRAAARVAEDRFAA